MTATLNIINTFTLKKNGITLSGKQGNTTDAATDEYSVGDQVTINGQSHHRGFSLATAAAQTIYDTADDFPTTFNYLHIWSDQALYIQIISAATNVILKTLAKVPFVLSVGSLLAAANTTAISGTEPTLAAVAKIVIQNNSGSTATGVFFLTN